MSSIFDSRKTGGFEDTRGTLFFEVAEIIKEKQPKAIFLENVKGLRSHDKGKTLATILNVLREDLNYYVPEPQIINAREFGVPQNRERIYIVGFRKDLGVDEFQYPEPINKDPVLKEGIRKMTPREWARLQGFPDSFKIVVSDAQAYKQFGNSVAVPAIQATAEKIIEKLFSK